MNPIKLLEEEICKYTGSKEAVLVSSGTSAIKTSIREGKTHQIDNIMQTSTEVGMNTLEMSLATLVKEGKVDIETAQSYSLRPEELMRLSRASK